MRHAQDVVEAHVYLCVSCDSSMGVAASTYAQLVNFQSNEYYSKVAKAVDKAGKPVESDFSFVDNTKGEKSFSKRK